MTLNYTSCYTYLGLVLNEYMCFSEGIKVLPDSAGRALRSVVRKMKQCPYLRFSIFTKLYDVMVSPVLFYAANPKLAVEGDMSWVSCLVKQRGEMVRL